jgi:hypothetical protein
VSCAFFNLNYKEKKPNNYSIIIKSKIHSQYTAGGIEGLIDGINGNENGEKEWQGYQDQDFEAVIDFTRGSRYFLYRLTFTRFSLLDFDASICSVYTSVDNINYKIVDSPSSVDPKDDTTRILPLQSIVSKVRYVKVFAKNFGKLPAWHQGWR